jgi:hypothetical protein
LFDTGVVDTGGKFAAGIVTPVANLKHWYQLVEKFAAGVVDTGGAP